MHFSVVTIRVDQKSQVYFLTPNQTTETIDYYCLKHKQEDLGHYWLL